MNSPTHPRLASMNSKSLIALLLFTALPRLDAQEAAKPDAKTPAALDQGSPQSPEWAKGWSVVRVLIPANGDLKDAYVDLQTPEGRTVTLTAGVSAKEGVALEKVEWAGSPVRAKVTLQKEKERAELFAEAGSVSKKDDLPRRLPQVEIDSTFIEMPDAIANALTFPRSAPFKDKLPGAPAGLPGGRALHLQTVLNEKDAEALLKTVHAQAGVEFLHAPWITTTRSQQLVGIEIIREFRYPTEYTPEKTKGGKRMVPTYFETRAIGLMLEFKPTLLEGDAIELDLTPRVTELLGFIRYPSGEMMPLKRDPSQNFTERLKPVPVDDKPQAPDEMRQPIFSTRTARAVVSMLSGQTVVLLCSDSEEGMQDLKPPSAGKQLLVLVRARRLPPEDSSREDSPASSGTTTAPETPAPASSAPAADVPDARPVEGKPGYVQSPHAPDAGYIDVRGFPAGTEVKDPYSGKMFKVPAPATAPPR